MFFLPLLDLPDSLPLFPTDPTQPGTKQNNDFHALKIFSKKGQKCCFANILHILTGIPFLQNQFSFVFKLLRMKTENNVCKISNQERK
jgi:hypothetical protein